MKFSCLFLFIHSYLLHHKVLVEVSQVRSGVCQKHSYLDHSYAGGLAFISLLQTQGSLSLFGTGGQNLRQL